MNSQTALLRIFFKLKIYRTSGMEFQVFFSNIMENLHNDFVSVKPHGNWGDGGNDGYNSGTQHYYQIYAPLASTEANPLKELNKAVTDFNKLLEKWGNIQGYSFVINDRFTQISAKLEKEFREFLEKENLTIGEIISASKLQKMFMTLDRDTQLDILDDPCIDVDPDAEKFEPSLIGELIEHLIEQSDDDGYLFNMSIGKAPEFDKKLIFNELNDVVISKLNSNYNEVYKIDEFLELNGDELSQELSTNINKIYKKILLDIPEQEEDKAALIYYSLRNALTPKSAKKDKRLNLCYNKIAEIIIAKYFSTCDVYEDPNSFNPT